MSSSDTPPLVRTTGLDPADGSAALAAEVGDLRLTVESLERRLADAESNLRERERDLVATHERLTARTRELERTREWAAFLADELRERDARIETLEAEARRETERREQVVARYEDLLSTSERETAGGLLSRLAALF